MASAELKHAIAAARTDLAYRSAVQEHDVIVVEAKDAEWPDEGLGCPEPAATYPPRPVPGYLIILDSVSREYEYHADRNGRIVYCGKRRQG